MPLSSKMYFITIFSMKEADLNRIITRTLRRDAWGFKIPDGREGIAVQNPFDVFGAIQGNPLYMESKLIKGGLYAFNFKKVESHQWKALLDLKAELPEALCLIAVGFWEARKRFQVMFFDVSFLDGLRNNYTSILRKDLQRYELYGMFLNIETVKENGKRVQYVTDLLDIRTKIISELPENM